MNRGTLISPAGTGLWETYSFIYSNSQLKAELTVCRTFRPEPEPDALFCIRQYARDTFCQPVIAECYFFFDRICRLYNCSFQFPYPEVFKLEHLLFTWERFFYFPSGKVESRNLYHIVFRSDLSVCCKHHGMLCNTINKDKIHVFSGCSDLYFYMGKVSIMTFSFVNQWCFDFAFSLISELCCRNPFTVEKEFSL